MHLPDGPGPLGVHGGVGAPRVGEFPRDLVLQRGSVLPGIDGLDVDALREEGVCRTTASHSSHTTLTAMVTKLTLF